MSDDNESHVRPVGKFDFYLWLVVSAVIMGFMVGTIFADICPFTIEVVAR